ncbi:GGDEF domain-containing protein [Kineosporia sp. A_224]|uniref:GGDEF domain-containing protein n=1 Tax=Kineosporia sp. A_224 TaxID=1962180 RepID=UPI000B4AFCAF|nr:GGDEF domain-containing protein [Kineosporia sp. A_224]
MAGLADPFMLLASPRPDGAREPDALQVLYANAAAEDLTGAVHGSPVHVALRRVLTTGVAERLRWRQATGEGAAVLDVRVTRVDEVTASVVCRESADVIPGLLVDAYRIADGAWGTLSSVLDAAPDAFLVLEVGPLGEGGPQPEQAVLRHYNRAAGVLVGVHEHDIGKPVHETLDPTWVHRLTDALARAGSAPVRYRSRAWDDEGLWSAAYDVTVVVADPGVGRVVVVLHDATDDERSHRRLEDERFLAERRARYDDLTGLLNRRTLHDHLRRTLAGTGPGRRVAVLFADLDGFKAVNDGYGHAAGDRLLAAVADRLGRAARTGDVAGRYGGDEFVVVMPDVPADWSPEATLARLARTLSEPVWVEGAVLTPSATLGAYLADPCARPADRDPLGVIAAADRVMYRLKAARAGDAGLPGDAGTA